MFPHIPPNRIHPDASQFLGPGASANATAREES